MNLICPYCGHEGTIGDDDEEVICENCDGNEIDDYFLNLSEGYGDNED